MRKISAKSIKISFIDKKSGESFIKKYHYSGKIAASGIFYMGVFLDNKIIGAIQYGRPIDKYKVICLVKDTTWDGFLELNRFVCIDNTPKNTESRALAISFKLIKKNYPHIKWILSFADACQCGSGTIYRASGFYLTQIKKNNKLIYINKLKTVEHKMKFTAGVQGSFRKEFMKSGVKRWQDFLNKYYGGYKELDGYQLRYIKILYPDIEINCPIIDYNELDKLKFPDNVRHQKRVASIDNDVPSDQLGEGGASPTATLQPRIKET